MSDITLPLVLVKCSKCKFQLQYYATEDKPIKQCPKCNHNIEQGASTVSTKNSLQAAKGRKFGYNLKGLLGKITTTWQGHVSNWRENKHEAQFQRQVSSDIDKQLLHEKKISYKAQDILRRSAEKADGIAPPITEEDFALLQKYGQTDQPKHHRIFVCGHSKAGKSTILKHLRIFYGEAFNKQEKTEIVKYIHNDIRNAILTIIQAMTILTPPVQLEHPENKTKADYLLNKYNFECSEYSLEFFEVIEVLWRDRGIQITFERRNEYYSDFNIDKLSDNAKYFLDRIYIIKHRGYEPSEQDILRCCYSDFRDVHIEIDKHIFDVTARRFRRIQYTAFIFVAACNSYDILLLPEDSPSSSSSTQLHANIKLFEQLWSHSTSNCIILLLNKEDLLAEKILYGISKLENFFPNFSNYRLPLNKQFLSNESPEVTKAKFFIRDQFLNICQMRTFSGSYCFPHFICAVDPKSTATVLGYVRSVIHLASLCHYRLF